VKQNKVEKREESASVLITSMMARIVETTLLRSGHRTQARQNEDAVSDNMVNQSSRSSQGMLADDVRVRSQYCTVVCWC
jgi:hypothetical protein